MNSASKVMAKWYQRARAVSPPSEREKISAMPTARLGAPPVRDRSVVSPTERVSDSNAAASSGKPQPLIVAAALATSVPIAALAELIAKYTPGCMMPAESSAITATKLSISMAP